MSNQESQRVLALLKELTSAQHHGGFNGSDRRTASAFPDRATAVVARSRTTGILSEMTEGN